MDMPVIRIEIENLRRMVMNHLATHGDEINEMVRCTLQQKLTEDWVKTSIQNSVESAIQEAINSVGGNPELRWAIESALADSLSKMINSSREK